jgi:bis(5'-nucleosyl)-tetraphosphatase (symmetrical)
MATYAIGDVHGCFQELQNLLSRINYNSTSDTLWFVGDLVNRGPQSLETLRFIQGLPDTTIVLLGNHDLHFLAVANGYAKPSAHDTLDALLAAQDCKQLCDWLRRQKLFYHDSVLGFIMVHAGIAPQWSRVQAATLAKEVERILVTDDYKDFLQNMYGNTPECWRDDLTAWDRLRSITNYLTRIRFCDEQGTLDLTSKSKIGTQPAGFFPWFDIKTRKTKDDKILFGHWAALQGKVSTDRIYALDTGCVWGGKLSALRLEDESWFQVNSSVVIEK